MGTQVRRNGKTCRTRITMLTSAISGLLLLQATAAGAQDADKTDDTQKTQGAAKRAKAAELESVQVSAKRLEETQPLELSRYGNRLQIIEGDEIARRGIVDVGTALQQMAPALFVMPKSGSFDYIYPSMEGSRANEILWTVDGVRINNRLYSTTTPLDTIPAAMIERIEILEGGQGLFYGTQAVAGVVNVVTKSFLSEGTDGRLAIGGDSNEGRHFSGDVRTALGPHQFVAYASSDSAEGYHAFREQDYQPSATDRDRGYDVKTAGLKYAVNSGGMRFSAGYQRTDAKLDYANPNLISEYYNQRYEDLANIKLDWDASDVFGLYAKGYYHKWDSYVNRYDNVIGQPGVVRHSKNQVFWGYEDYGLNAMAKYAPGYGFEYYLGYDYQNYSGEDDSLLIARQREEVHAAIAQVRTTHDFIDKLNLAAGFRYNKPKEGDSATVWNVSGQYDLTPSLFLRATGGTAYRLPDASELFGIDPCCEQGNPKLKPEQSRNFNASIGGYFDLMERSASWELVGFTRKVDHLIAAAVDPVTNILTYQNSANETKVNGFLVTATLPLTKSLTATATYTKTDAKSSGLQISRIPESSAKILFDLAPADSPFGGSLIVNYVGKTYQTISLGRPMYGDYWLLDLSGYMQFGDANRQRITARIENLTDKEYTTNLLVIVPDAGGSRYTTHNIGAPRTFYLTYSYDF